MSTRIGVVTGQPLFQVDGRPRFLPGANYAWHRYGEFGDSIWGGVNRIAARPVIVRGTLAERQVMNLSSSFDHRVIDGALAAAFVQSVRGMLERAATLFIS